MHTAYGKISLTNCMVAATITRGPASRQDDAEDEEDDDEVGDEGEDSGALLCLLDLHSHSCAVSLDDESSHDLMQDIVGLFRYYQRRASS